MQHVLLKLNRPRSRRHLVSLAHRFNLRLGKLKASDDWLLSLRSARSAPYVKVPETCKEDLRSVVQFSTLLFSWNERVLRKSLSVNEPSFRLHWHRT